jgi:hypothetical protein
MNLQSEKATFEAFEKISEINLKMKILMEILIKRLNTDISNVAQKKIKFEDSKNKEQLTGKSIIKFNYDVKASDHMKTDEYKKYCALSEKRRDYLRVITNNGTSAEKEDAQKMRMEYLYEAKSLHDTRIKLEYVILDVKILDLQFKKLDLDHSKLKKEKESEQQLESKAKKIKKR